MTPASVAAFAGVLADRSRMTMCLVLLDRRAWTAGELARHAGIARSTASEHLHLLVARGVVTEVHQGRHRYVRLATAEMAQLIEDLGAVAGVPQRPPSSATIRAAYRLASARTCYDHLAGTLGVAVFDALLGRRLLDEGPGLSLTTAGREWCEGLGVDVAPEVRRTRPLLRTCLDWTRATVAPRWPVGRRALRPVLRAHLDHPRAAPPARRRGHG
jgi:DNA-binding transcriptional ArsR family regulator